MKLDARLFSYSVLEDREELEEKLMEAPERIQNMFMYLVFNLNHFRMGTVDLLDVGENECRVAWKKTKGQRKELTIAALVSQAFPDPGLCAHSCRYIDDGRGYHFLLRCSEDVGSKAEIPEKEL